MKKITKFVLLALAGLGATCFISYASMSKGGIVKRAPFGKTADGTPVEIYTLRNINGMEARIMTYGGAVVSLKVPDKKGKLGDVVLGCDNLEGYLTNSQFFGALIGRCANRIANGKFTLDGQNYTLATNNPPNHLHGGVRGFDKVVWQAKPAVTFYGDGLELEYVSKDGEEGYPGNLTVKADYVLTEKNELVVQFTATTDKDTICNLTQHSYFNLAGKGDILNHVVQIFADKFTPTDSTSIPTGEIKSVEGTPFDFRQSTAIGARINEDNEQLKFCHGYDHNWVFDKVPGEFQCAADVYEPTTGRKMEVWTSAPGMQFYTGNFLDGTIKGKGGWVYKIHDAFCMEPQDFPDAPNHPNFPSAELKPGEIYKNTIIYKFSTE